MYRFIKLIFLFGFIITHKNSFSQEPHITDIVEDKVAIGFPGITSNQLNLIKTEFAKYDHIASAKYVFGNYKEMVIVFNTNQPYFHTYYDMLKVISPIYEVEKCYFDEKPACDALLTITNETFFQVK